MPGNFVAAGTVHNIEPKGSVLKVTLVSDRTNRKTRQLEPSYVTVTLFSGHAPKAVPGAYLVIFGNVEGREYQGKFYTDLVAETVDVVGGNARPSVPPAQRQAPPARPAPADEWDDGVAPF